MDKIEVEVFARQAAKGNYMFVLEYNLDYV